jgi:hypothetical protein
METDNLEKVGSPNSILQSADSVLERWRTKKYTKLSEIQEALSKALDSIPSDRESYRLALEDALKKSWLELETLQSIVQKLHEHAEKTDEKPAPGRPATKEELLLLKERFGTKLPKDYVEFMTTWGGYKNIGLCTFFSPDEILNPGRKANRIKKQIESMQENLPDKRVLIIGIHYASNRLLSLSSRKGYVRYTFHLPYKMEYETDNLKEFLNSFV